MISDIRRINVNVITDIAESINSPVKKSKKFVPIKFAPLIKLL